MKSSEELWDISHKGRYELVKGEIIEMKPSGYEHGLLTMELSSLVRNHIVEKDLGVLLAAETGIKLPNGDVRAADITFICKENRPCKNFQKIWGDRTKSCRKSCFSIRQSHLCC